MSKQHQQPSEKQVMKWFREGTKGNIESQIKYTNYYKNLWNKYSYQPGSTMIHEKDYQPMNCCLCGKEMVSIHDTNNPAPLAPHTYAKEAQENNLPHRCCGECDRNLVLPARARKMNPNNDPSIKLLDLVTGFPQANPCVPSVNGFG